MPLRLRGRIVLRTDHQLVVEIALDCDLDWDPRDAELLWRGESPYPVEIDPDGTTRPGRHCAGQVLRLVLAFGAPQPSGAAPARVRMTSGRMSLLVRLR